jgi:hypothetical protein
MENKSSNLLLTVIGVATLLVAIAGASFAFFTATASTTDQNVATGKLVVSATTGSVTGANIKPVAETALSTDFDSIKANNDIVKIPVNVNTSGTTITTANTDKVIADLDLYLTAISGFDKETYTNGVPTDIKWKLVNSTGAEINSGEFDKSATELRLTTNPTTLNITSDVTSYDYTLLVYIEETNENQDDLQGLTLSATVRADVKQNADA